MCGISHRISQNYQFTEQIRAHLHLQVLKTGILVRLLNCIDIFVYRHKNAFTADVDISGLHCIYWSAPVSEYWRIGRIYKSKI